MAKAKATRGKQAPREQTKQKAVPVKRSKGPAGLLTMTLLLLAVLYAGALVFLRPAAPGKQVALSDVIAFAACSSTSASAATPSCAKADSKVLNATFLDEDSRIIGTLEAKTGGARTEFWTSYPRSDAATNDLLRTFYNSGTEVTVDSQPAKGLVRFLAQFLLPLVILANLFALLFSMSRGGGSGTSEFLTFGRIGEKMVSKQKKTVTTFANIAAAEEQIIELSEVRDYLADPTSFQKMGALPPKGVLLVGPPGCGKTLLARAVAGEANASFYSISGSEFVESLVGVGAARVRDLFRQARTSTPAIIFIDELDAVGRQRGAGLGGGHDEREQTLNELLVQMDGFSPTEGVVVVAATNRPDILDPALLRAGRFDRHITVERPDLEDRLAILKLHARSRRLGDPESDLPHIASNTPGFTGADLSNVLNEAALLAVRERADSIDRHHLEEAVERVLSGPRRKTRLISDIEKRRIAYHEAGHAVVAAAMGRTKSLQKLSVIARGRGIGHLAVLQEDKTILTREDMEEQVTIAMGGLAAEEMIFGQPSTGSEADLERATNAARDMAGRFGMSSRLGRVRVLREHREVFLGRDYLMTKDVSQPTLEHLDVEVRRILDEQEEFAADILQTNRAVLDELAGRLISQETVEGHDLEAILSSVRTPAKRSRSGNGAATAATAKPRARAARRSTARTSPSTAPAGDLENSPGEQDGPLQ